MQFQWIEKVNDQIFYFEKSFKYQRYVFRTEDDCQAIKVYVRIVLQLRLVVLELRYHKLVDRFYVLAPIVELLFRDKPKAYSSQKIYVVLLNYTHHVPKDQ